MHPLVVGGIIIIIIIIAKNQDAKQISRFYCSSSTTNMPIETLLGLGKGRKGGWLGFFFLWQTQLLAGSQNGMEWIAFPLLLLPSI